MRIVLLSDCHFSKGKSSSESSFPERYTDIADILFLRLIHRINKYLKPDISVICGDLTDSPEDAESLEVIAQYLKLLQTPVIVVPGNHDLPAEAFYQHIPRPPEYIDIKGFRFIPFIDPERPSYKEDRT